MTSSTHQRLLDFKNGVGAASFEEAINKLFTYARAPAAGTDHEFGQHVRFVETLGFTDSLRDERFRVFSMQREKERLQQELDDRVKFFQDASAAK